MTKQEKFIAKSNIIHNNKYDYSMVEYVNTYSRVVITCPIHGQFTQVAKDHQHGCGCKQCGNIKRNQTCLDRYGHTNAAHGSAAREKIKQTNLRVYGCTTYNNRKKATATCLEKYGVEHPSQNIEVHRRMESTCLEKYGVDNPRKSEKVKEKIKITNRSNHGGVHNKQQHLGDKILLLKDKCWMENEYIVNRKTTAQIADECLSSCKTIQNYMRAYGILFRYKNKSSGKSTTWIKNLIRSEGIDIQSADSPLGEYKIPGTNYRVDGYCRETNTVYEFHGDRFHGNPSIFRSSDYCHPFDRTLTAGELYQKTKDRENIIKALGYDLVVMWENIWDNTQVI